MSAYSSSVADLKICVYISGFSIINFNLYTGPIPSFVLLARFEAAAMRLTIDWQDLEEKGNR